ncbi:MAG: MraY family glycosyltransferase [Candidatus Pacebacteria bacterium]|nr:MraY family glycosyltransferase [Candidatus Paceibacterota bacterium]
MLFLFIFLFGKVRWQGRDSERHIHRSGVSRVGGLAMVLAFNAAILLDKELVISPELWGFMFGTIALLVVGIWDDLKELYWKIQLFCQIAAAVFVFIAGVRIFYITNPLTGGIINLDSGFRVVVSAMLVILWILVVINALNWSDGIDGMAGSVTLITAATIFFLSLAPEVNQPPVAIISAILGGVALAFLVFNFYPSKVLAGTSGSMFMGFSLAVLAIFAGTKIATAILVLIIPIIDFLWVIAQRLRHGQSIFRPDKNHLHHKLMQLGWSQRKITLVYTAITALMAALALNTRAVGKGVTLLLVAIASVAVFVFINKKTTLEKSEKPTNL